MCKAYSLIDLSMYGYSTFFHFFFIRKMGMIRYFLEVRLSLYYFKLSEDSVTIMTMAMANSVKAICFQLAECCLVSTIDTSMAGPANVLTLLTLHALIRLHYTRCACVTHTHGSHYSYILDNVVYSPRKAFFINY